MRSVLLAMVIAVPGMANAQPAPAAEVQAEADDPRLGWRSARWACIGAGTVAILLGGGAFLEGLKDEDVVSSADKNAEGAVTSLSQREALRMQDNAERFKTLGAVGMTVGVTLIATGVTFWVLEPDAPKVAPKDPEPVIRPFSLLPTVGPDGPGMAFTAFF